MAQANPTNQVIYAIGIDSQSYPLLRDASGALIVTGSGGGGASNVNLTQVGGSPILLGQNTMVNSLPVAIASNQTAIPVTQGTSPWVVSGTVTTSPNVNVHDGAGVSITSTGSSLNVDVTNTVPVTLASTTITGNVTVVQPSGAALHVDVDNTVPVSNQALSNITGTWKYYAGTAATVTVGASERVTGLTAHATLAGTVTINGGPAITVPANSSFNLQPGGNLVAPTIVFTGTDAYVVETVL